MKKQLQARFAPIAVAAAALVASGAAMADDPNLTAATTAIGTIGTNATAMFTAAWPVIVLVTGGFILIGMFKKVATRAGR
jgi:hypothetical protein